MRGSLYEVNQSLSKPVLLFGIERRLFLLLSLLTFLVASMGRYSMQSIIMAAGFFTLSSLIARFITKHDPMMTVVFKRASRYISQSHYPPVGHPKRQASFVFTSVQRGNK